VGREHGRFGEGRERVDVAVTPPERTSRHLRPDGFRREHVTLAADGGRVDAGLRADPLRLFPGTKPPHVHLGWLIGGHEPDLVPGADDRLHLKSSGSHGLSVDQQAACVLTVADGEQPAGGQPSRHTWR
jgi:hypothetical protein